MDLSFNFIGNINDENIITLINYIISNEVSNQIDKLIININSTGGNVNSGITIYNFLKGKTFPIITHNIGEVSSAAILLYLAGNIRTSEDISKFMIHPLTINTSENISYYKLKEISNNLLRDIKNYASIVNNETNNMNGKHNINTYLKYNNIVFNKKEAYKNGIVTNM